MAAKFSLSDSLAERQKLTTAQSREIERLYKDLAKKAAKEAEKLKSSTRSGKLQAVELGKLEKKLQEEADKIGARLESSIPSAMKKAAAGVVSDATAFQGKLGISIEGAYRRVPTDIVETLVSGKLYKGKWSLSKSIWADVSKTQSDISKVVAEGIALNKSSYDIAKDLEMYVDPSAKKPWDWSKVYPGTKKKIDYNAQRLARTMVGHAYQQSVMATCKDDPFVDGIEWISGHTSSSCELCEKRDGKIFPADQLPLDHPNGKCSFAPAVSKSLTQISDELADWVQGKPNPEIDKWMSQAGGSLDLLPELNTRGFKSMSEEEFKSWQRENSTLQRIYKDFEKKWGVTLRDGMLPQDQDRFIEEEGEWLYDLLNKARDNYQIAVGTTGHRYSYVQNAEWSKNINKYWRTGDSSFLVDYHFRGKVTKKKAQQLAQESLQGIKKTSHALDSLIGSTKLDQDMVVSRWGGINSLGSLGISSDLYTGRVGHAFVTQGLDLDDIKKRVDNLIGTTMVDNGYMSASACGDLNVFQGSDIKFTINVPKGTNAFVTDNTMESEVIFGRGTKTEITGCRIIESEAKDSWTGETVKTKSLEIFLNLIP